MATSAPVTPGDTPGTRAKLVLGQPTFKTVNEDIASIVESKPTPKYLLGLMFAASILLVMVGSLVKLVYSGVGVWGLDNTVFWAWDITGFVFWIGIGHAGTLISAILFLFRQKWRTSITRAAEAMTIFAVMAAGIYPAFHVGRVWLLYWVFPVPNQMSMWPNFKSPLLWDVFAVSTYATVSILFWYLGLVPDLATIRDRAKTKLRYLIYGILSLGWRGSHRGWLSYEKAYLILAGLSTPLVLSVHTVVSFDFATSVVPGWHTTIFPPYFVAGAIFSGFAMVITLMIVARKVLGLEHMITIRHLENMSKIILATGSMVGYAYAIEFFIAWYGAVEYERYAFLNRMFGPYWWAYWSMVSCNVIFPQLFWFKKVRTSIPALFAISIVVNIGMWFERFVIIVTSLHRDYIPSSWTYFTPSIWDISLFVGTFGLFLTMFLLFCKFLPVIAASEVKGVMPQADPHGDDHHGKDEEAHAHG
ncbi:MAG: polysulfide reductase NrfD [Polyangiaceae bacterium]|nr:polysulfide reductase NrfD [Polyangiaceae bacterium]